MPDVWKLNVSPSTLGKVYLAVCLLLSFIQKGYSLHCVQCMSFNDDPCVKGTLKPSLCAGRETNSKYCHKAIGHETGGGGRIVFRTCSHIPQNNCTHERIRTIKSPTPTMFKICRYSCETEGCNSASRGYLQFGALCVSLFIAAEQLLLLFSAL